MAGKVMMVAFLTHTRGDVLLMPGTEFEVSEEESHAYAARKNPLAGRLDAQEAKAPEPRQKPKAPAGREKKAK